MMLDVYRDAKLVRELVERLAGGPLRCASQLGTVDRIPGLSEFADAQINRLPSAPR